MTEGHDPGRSGGEVIFDADTERRGPMPVLSPSPIYSPPHIPTSDFKSFTVVFVSIHAEKRPH